VNIAPRIVLCVLPVRARQVLPRLQYATIAILVLVVSVLATTLAFLRLARSIADRVVQLTAIAHRISIDRDYSVRAGIRSGPETGLLVLLQRDAVSNRIA
jgi:hypothetical protein